MQYIDRLNNTSGTNNLTSDNNLNCFGLSPEFILQKGREIVKLKVNHGMRLYKTALQTRLSVSNLAYNDTLNEIEIFFKLYDVDFKAHEVPCMIDYQLMYGVHDQEGIDYINGYLTRLIWENKFCSFFDDRNKVRLYEKYAIDYKEQLINLCDPLYTNATGSILSGKSFDNLRLTQREQNRLKSGFLKFDEEKINEMISKTNSFLCKNMGFVNKATDYFAKVSGELSSRINNLKFHHGFKNLFIQI